MHSPWSSAGEQWNIPHGTVLGCALLCLCPALPVPSVCPLTQSGLEGLGILRKKKRDLEIF